MKILKIDFYDVITSVLYCMTVRVAGEYHDVFVNFSPVTEPGARSRINIPFRVGKGDDALEAKFVAEAMKQGLVGLAGHPYVINSSVLSSIFVLNCFFF